LTGKARDVVRAIIERLIGGKAADAAGAKAN